MKKHFILLNFILFLALSCVSSQSSKDQSNDPELIWFEDFDGAGLNQGDWNFQTGTGSEYGLTGWGNNELQYYTGRKENVYLENGFLIIEARRESYEGQDYTSGRINTKGKKDWKYGVFEIRAKLTKTQGIWPAIWMLPTTNEYGGWPLSGEIDIMEQLGHQPDTVYGTVHFGNSFNDRNHISGKIWKSEGSYSDEFHIYKIEWIENKISWYVDGQLYHEISKESIEPYNWPFDQEFHLLLNVAVGGNWPGYPDESTILPQRMLIDYIKVYQPQ